MTDRAQDLPEDEGDDEARRAAEEAARRALDAARSWAAAQPAGDRRMRQSDLARELGVTRQAIGDLVRRKILAKGVDGLISLAQAKAAIAQCVRPSGKTAAALDAAADAGGPALTGIPTGDSYHEARAVKEIALAGIAQDKLEKLAASLIDSGQAIAAGRVAFAQLVDQVLPIAARLAPHLAVLTQPREVNLAHDAAVREAFAAFTDRARADHAPAVVEPVADAADEPPITSFYVARTRKEEAEGRAAQLELAQRKGLLVEKDRAKAARFTAFRQLRDGLVTIGRKQAAIVATLTDAGEIQAKLEAAYRETLAIFEGKTLAAFGEPLPESIAPAAATADGFAEIMLTIAHAMEPDPELKVDVWSEEHVVIPKGSAFSGPYRISHTPYARRVLQCLSPGHPASRIVVMAASQMLKTQVFINAALAWIDLAPANILALEPTDKLAKRLSARVSKAMEACSKLEGKVAKPRSRDAANTVDRKEFSGGAVHITTAGAAANLAEIPARYVFCDEVDRMEVSVNGEGDPVALAEARATTYEGQSKAYHVSSPTVAGASKIAKLHARGTQEEYHVPCPHCGHLHALSQDNFKYSRDDETGNVTRAWFVCPACWCEIEEHAKTTMLPDVEMGGQARWVATAQGDGETVSFHINAFYAPLGSISWLSLARQHAIAEEDKGKGDPSALQVYENTRLAKVHDNSESTSSVAELQRRGEAGHQVRVIPDAALVLTMAVDTQPNRLEVQIEAWGPWMENWLIDYIVLAGDPSEPPNKPGSVWQRLDAIRRTPFAHASGSKPIPISAYAIDSGGANTQDVYNYGAARASHGCVIIKGHNKPNRPIISSAPSRVDIEWNGTKTEGGALLWLIGTDVAKDWIHNRLKLEDGAGAMHYPRGLPVEWYEGLLAERKRLRYVKGFAVREWIKNNGDRNEPLDLKVYNLAIAHHLGLHKWSALDWQRLRAKLVPPNLTRDLFAAADVDQAPPPAPAIDRADLEPQPLEPELEAAPAPAPAPTPAPAPIAPMPLYTPPRPAAGRRIYSRGV